MLYEREKCLIALLESAGGVLSRTDFQTLLFLFCKEYETDPPYEFVPYKLGGFSFTADVDCNRLAKQGFFKLDEKTLELADAVESLRTEMSQVRAHMAQFMRQYKEKRGDALLVIAYQKYPYIATHCEVANRLLSDDSKALKAIEDARPARKSGGLCTIGYEGRSLEGYLNSLIGEAVTILCDVRGNPFSRKFGFSKETLKHACEGVGIRYEHLRELGIEKEKRRDVHTPAEYDALFAKYERDTLSHRTESIMKICDWINSGEHVALTCYEADPQRCHRHCVADAIVKKMPTLGDVIQL